ncbi:MAG: hypothetical protein ACFCVD_13050 [Nodosilinea sp.]
MNKQFVAISLTYAVAGALGILSFVAPAHACDATDNRIGVSDCRTFSIIGGPPPKSVMLAYKQRQEQQLTMAVASYNQAFNTNIAQWQVQRPLMVHRLQMGELA